MTDAQYLRFAWPISIAIELILAFLLMYRPNQHRWFATYIFFDVGRSVTIFLLGLRWSAMVQSPEYCRFFVISESLILPLMALMAVEAAPRKVRSWVSSTIIIGSGAVVAALTFPTEQWPAWMMPAIASRVWIDAMYLVCWAVFAAESSTHGRIMAAFFAINCAAYLSLILFNPHPTTPAACIAISGDAIAYGAWVMRMTNKRSFCWIMKRCRNSND